tara:strand:- start:85821 stop:86201 length:381 start_codon:yes stop_codon:yes gene_type:complete
MKKPPKPTGIARIIKAAGYSWDGIIHALRNETAFRQEVILAIILTPIASLLPIALYLKLLLISSFFLVLIVELINCSLELAVDYISSKKHPTAKKIKDMGSAAVCLSLIFSGVLWVFALVECLRLQ